MVTAATPHECSKSDFIAAGVPARSCSWLDPMISAGINPEVRIPVISGLRLHCFCCFYSKSLRACNFSASLLAPAKSSSPPLC
jgi:hypothetical protein